MRTPEATIKAAILHPVEEIRTKALDYFGRGHTQDTTLMPLVIQAVEKYDRDNAFAILRGADRLPQTEETVTWLTAELGKEWHLENVTHDNYCFAIALILCQTRTTLLDPVMADLPCFPEELKNRFLKRLEMASWDWQTGWSALEKLGREARERGEYRLKHTRYGELIVESLARHHDKAEVLLPLLQRRYRGHEKNLMQWLEGFLIELAGKMRLEAAAPVLVERMLEDDEWLSDACTMALPCLGGDVVARALADHWRRGGGDFRRGAAEIMGHIHTDLSVQKLLEFFPREKDEDTKDFLANALLDNFVPQAVEPIRQMVLDDELSPDEMDLKYHLIAACTIMGVTFAEYERWYKQAVKDNFGWHDHKPDRIRNHFQEKEEDEKRDEADDLGDDDYDEDYFEEAPVVLPIRTERTSVGRNDPCPCGSGRKYKKCCMNKDQDRDFQPKFPVGTIALYGPDDRKTTKIAASVIKREGAEPILERWMGSKVKDEPKVHREIMEFFRQHGVKSVITTEENMGCPHEEGEDFPVGGDCPFCPYWKGKQGSGTEK